MWPPAQKPESYTDDAPVSAEEILEADLYHIFRSAKHHQIVAAMKAARRYAEYWAGSTPHRQVIH